MTEPEVPAQLKKLMDRGIAATQAEFHTHVNNGNNTPESSFSIKSDSKERKVEMWWINGDGLLCNHAKKWFLVPSSNVKFVKF